jgi:hypothetical protein
MLLALLLARAAPAGAHCSAQYGADPLPRGHALLASVLVFKHGVRAPVDKVPGFDAQWNCSGDTWLYPGGHPLADRQPFLAEFRLRPIPGQSFLRGSCRAGELLPAGAAQMHALAAHASQAYGALLPRPYAKRAVGWRSTYSNRCLACQQALAHELFRGGDPIDVFVANEELESLVPNGYLCPALQGAMGAVLGENASFGARLARFTDKIERIKREWELPAMPHWTRMAELLVTHDCTGVAFTPGTDRSLMEEAMAVLVEFYRAIGREPRGKQFMSGILISEIYLMLRDYLVGSSDAAVTFVCGHTLSIVALETALNLSAEWPAFGAFIAFDLTQSNDGGRGVRVAINGKTEATFGWAEFERLALALRPTEAECGIVYPYPEPDKKSLGMKMLHMAFS